MRLKKIEVMGFKSFADRQVVVVDDHVTGVIGPNGCGKSNIVDALRWCMGEQSAKHLRGSGMADVIFAGCTTRGPAGSAEVTVTFENQGDTVEAHFDHPEIAITRRLYADGTSEYLINKVPSRLRDITQLLLGTGAGTKGYSIIEQGQVGRIVSSKPEERRHIIDEAAGITRFKAQKAAAQRKIEATRQNLLRVTDVVGELESRLSTLKRQAQKAERYKRYKEELRDLDLWTASHKFLELQATGTVLEQRRTDLETQSADLKTALSGRETEIEARRTSLLDVEQQLSERQQSVYDLDNRIRLLEAENEYRKREREGLVESGAGARAEGEAVRRTLESTETELAEVAGQREALGDAEGPDGQAGVVTRLESEHRRLESEMAGERNRVDSARVELGELTAANAGAQARHQSHTEALEAGLTQQTDARQALEETTQQLRAARAELEQARAQVEQAQAELDTLASRRAELDAQRVSLKDRVAAGEVELDTKRAEIHRHRSRLQSLEEIQNRYRGCHSGVQVIMEHAEELAPSMSADGMQTEGGASPSHPAVFGILADYVNAPAHLETAVSAVLGDRLEGVVVDGPKVGARGVELLKREQEGRTTFVPRRPRAPSKSGGSDEAKVVELVEGMPLGWWNPAAREMPKAPFEVIDLSEVESLPEGAESAETVEDLAAEIAAFDSDLYEDDASTPAPATSAPADSPLLRQEGVLGRLSELVEVTGELASLGRLLLERTVVVESLGRALELWESYGTDDTLVTLEGDRIESSGVVIGGSPNSLNSAILQQKREIRELTEILESLDEDFDDARKRHLALAGQLSEVEAARERSEAEVLDAERVRVSALAERDRLDGETQRLEGERNERETTQQRLDGELTQRRTELSQLQDAIEHGGERIQQLTDAITSGESRTQELEAERDHVAESLTNAKVELAKFQQQSDALSATQDRLVRQVEAERQRISRLEETAAAATRRVSELDEATAAATTEREQLIEQSRQATAQVHSTRETFDALRLEIDELEASMRTLRGDLEERRERLSEVELGLQEIHLERGHLHQDIRDRFDIGVHEVLIDFHDRTRAGKAERDRQKELKRILSRMGEVNLTAIDEYEEVSQRYQYLTGQKADLEEAIEQLQEAIDKINTTTRELFGKTFEAVNERFQVLFPRLFGGGQAQLKMTDPSDLLTTGVEIEARPPGKQPRTLDLLSGGEKALTAVSLIFAIFLIKPSPFCLLDEVDAPLDDANVARFCSLVRELAGDTQFIIITHNKVTMETADRLYGVTMEQRGISKLVSVNLRRAVELAYN